MAPGGDQSSDQNPVPRPPGQCSPSSTLCPCPQPAPGLVYIPKNALLGEGERETSIVGSGDDWVRGSSGAFTRSPDYLLWGCRVDWLCKSLYLQACGERSHESVLRTPPPSQSCRKLQQQSPQAEKTLRPCWLVFYYQ